MRQNPSSNDPLKMPTLQVQTCFHNTNQSHKHHTNFTSAGPLSPSNSIDTDVEYFPSNFQPASAKQVNRFTELTGTTPRQAKKYLHQHRDFVTGHILFDDAVSAYFHDHDHEDDEEYVYGEDGCFCLENAADLVLTKIVREVREEIGREQGDEETLWYGVKDKVLMRTKIGWVGHENSDAPLMVIERVKEMVDLVMRRMGYQTPSLHELVFGRSPRSKSL